MKPINLFLAGMIGFAWMAPAALAADEHASHSMPQMAAPMAHAALSDGEIRKVNKSAGKVTIKHGPLANLNMPPMTMVFHVKDSAWLDQMKAGSKIRFNAESINGALTVTQFEPMN